MPEDPPETVTLALFFEDQATLGHTVSVLQDVEKIYRSALSAATPPDKLADANREQPQIKVSSGSLFVELSSAVEPGAWAFSAIAVLKFALNNVEEAVPLPASIRAKRSECQLLAAQNREKFIAIVERDPAVDERAYRRIQEIRRRAATAPAIQAPGGRRGEDSLGDWAPAAIPDLMAAAGGSTVQAKVDEFRAVAPGAEAIRGETVRLIEYVELMLDRVAPDAAAGSAEELRQAVAALQGMHQGLGELTGNAGLTQANLDLYVARVRNYGG